MSITKYKAQFFNKNPDDIIKNKKLSRFLKKQDVMGIYAYMRFYFQKRRLRFFFPFERGGGGDCLFPKKFPIAPHI
jgi:hypothetical protein